MEPKIRQWRLILGDEVQDSLDAIDQSGGGMSENDMLLDQALSDIYASESFSPIGEGGSGAGNSKSMPKASKWLGDINKFFEKDIAKIIQNDAIERCGLKSLLLEPEVLENMEPNINLAATIMNIKGQIPTKSKDSVRIFIKKVVDEINKKMATSVVQVVTSKLNKREHSPIPSAAAIDFKYTINKNIKNYNQELKTIIPERVYFFDRGTKNDSNKWTIILDVDKSGSMGESVIYSSVLSCILASINSVKTKIVTFDTEVLDLTDLCSDPVELLYGFELGGGTDINKSLKYCQTLIENPKKTLLFMVTDLYEFGNVSHMLQRLKFMKESGVTVVCLLAISDQGAPYYDKNLAEKLVKMGIPCFACSPNRLPDLLDAALHQKDMSEIEKDQKMGKQAMM